MLVPMKKATLYGLLCERENVLLALQKCGQFMAIEEGEGDAPLEQDVAKTQESIRFLAKYEGKQPVFAQREGLSAQYLFEKDEEAIAARKEASELTEQLLSLKSKAATLMGQADGLAPWNGLGIPMSQVTHTKYARVFTGLCAQRSLMQLIAALEEAGAEVAQLGEAKEGRALLVICHEANEAQVRDAFKLGFSEMALPKLDKTPEQAQADYRAQAEKALMQAQKVEERATALSVDMKRIKALYDSEVARRDRARVHSDDGDATFCMLGWVREDMLERVNAALDAATDAYAIEYADPGEDDEPPVYTKNNRVVTPFEFVTNLYARPAYGKYDPNAIMSPFYAIFFGMMLSDAGYGLVLLVLLTVFKKLMKPRGGFAQIIGVLQWGSISTIFWGAMFGSYFGVEIIPPLMFSMLEKPMDMLILCYALGIIHLFVGMGIKMVLDFKAGNWQEAVFGTISWFVMYGGIGLLAASAMGVAPFPTSVGGAVAIVGVLMILLMTKYEEKNILKRIAGGAGALYNISGFLSDVLSYSRLFAMGLATGVIAMVFNTIGGMLLGIPIIGIIFFVAFMIFGHVFNIALNTLGSFVHSARLQYIEFFGKFYESGGKAFRPLALNTKYVEVIDPAAQGK